MVFCFVRTEPCIDKVISQREVVDDTVGGPDALVPENTGDAIVDLALLLVYSFHCQSDKLSQVRDLREHRPSSDSCKYVQAKTIKGWRRRHLPEEPFRQN